MIGAPEWHIVVVPHDPNWVAEFHKIERELLCAIGNLIVGVEHVGSTSVAELYAKPIIDIDVVIEEHHFAAVKNALFGIGYEHVGDLGIAGREAFKYRDKPHLMEHHLYVCGKDSPELKRHLALRDYLRTHSTERDRYSRIKIEMAEKFPHDIDRYLLGKEPVILDIYRKSGV